MAVTTRTEHRSIRRPAAPRTRVPARRLPRLKVAVFTTSYPKFDGDFSGGFVAGTVAHLRERGLHVEVVAPGGYNDFGLTANNGAGLVGNLKRKPWVAPLVFLSMVRALRRAAKGCDLVHANWLAGAVVAAFSGKPFVVTLHGSPTAGRFEDLALARRAPWLVRLVLGRARAVICCSEKLERAMRECGLENVHAIAYGKEIPAEIPAEVEPPHVLYVGRLSVEKGIDVIGEATKGLDLVVAGDGPLRDLLPQAQGFLPPEDISRLYSRAAVVVLASRAEGLPNVLLEAMAHGRAVVTTPVGGIPTVVEDGETGLLVPTDDPAALREALDRLLADPALRRRLGQAARARIVEFCSWDRVTDATLAVYAAALDRPKPIKPSPVSTPA
ncbi:MAG: glycosyltransferase family 4 protein [Gaiellaceae bacterium]